MPPDRFFAAVGEELARQVDEFADELAAQAGRGEGYLVQAGRLMATRAQAIEIVLREPVFLPLTSADGDDPDEEETRCRREAGDGRWSWTVTTRRGRRVNVEQHERINGPTTD